jgi:hypothetical protein
MSNCPKNDAGHEPLHHMKPGVTEIVTVDYGEQGLVTDAERPVHHVFKFNPGDNIDGPAGLAHACKHCLLVYFVPDAEEIGKN